MTAASESAILKATLLRASRFGMRLFRNQVGAGVAGVILREVEPGVFLVRGRRVTMGLCTGSSDLIGWKPVTITSDMVGSRVASFVALETKSASGRATPEQINFIDRVLEAGGISAIVRAPEDIDRIRGSIRHG
ncbi:MAG: VRR-NUC domain-containing protein [Alphaproteobacteria bacterium]|nr:VRR-NUC domain-containing protein [Alphaproteobacteria bacterium]